mmetsp:Transcript_16815/g.25421  ORF Transcript_16815/g.25421 Transcript_16815/m.25421 type:complete len:341 (+) Transcript_16815:118-1140(+)|eukprot:CAMPEP_0178912672 /NCGR_PEP_ID=MMETSP0786-20121207/10405_1 /TAXON_ID=186022 /ORGANISM="Thalassionema frauenfeldii, Strain CCMP 1798" /LENGTH=340 /DNA_ID=CAMNT_0020585305 /DNA_START=90 /DNA_END=1112 /DNA_ORIENTATION=-
MNPKLQIVIGLGVVAIACHLWFEPSYWKSGPNLLEHDDWDDSLFRGTKFCDESGKCGERSDKASPRTYYSSRSKKEYKEWIEMTDILSGSAVKYESRRHNQRREFRRMGSVPNLHPPLILLGDSITESWLGTRMGQLVDRATGISHLVNEYLEPHYDPLVLGISGDQTQHLLYRLQNGELIPEYAHDKEAVFVVLIGTNNIGEGVLPKQAAMGVKAVVEHLLKHTKGHVMLMKVLPRGDSEKLKKLCKPRCDAEGNPFKSFLPSIEGMNTVIEKTVVPKLKRKFGKKRLSLMDCGKKFLETGEGRDTKNGLMPDGLHPNAEGHTILAQCILDCAAGQCGE